MKSNIICCVLVFIFLIGSVYASASAAAAGAAAAASIARQQQEAAQQRLEYGGCALPLNFSKENKCQLEYPHYSDRKVGSFVCRNKDYTYYLMADCLGGIESYNQVENFKYNTSWKGLSDPRPVFIAVGIIIALMFIVALIRKLKGG